MITVTGNKEKPTRELGDLRGTTTRAPWISAICSKTRLRAAWRAYALESSLRGFEPAGNCTTASVAAVHGTGTLPLVGTINEEQQNGAILSFGRGASKSTTQGGIFDLNMYVTFDCAGIAAFWKHRWKAHVEQYQHCCSHFNFSNTHIVTPTSGLKVIPWVLFSRSFLRRSLLQKLWCEVVFGFCCATQY